MGAPPDASAPTATSSRDAQERAEKRRGRLEWFAVAGTIAAVFLLLGYLTYQEARAARFGFFAGIGWRSLQTLLLVILIFSIFTLGLNLQFGYTGLINFGHVAFFAVGAYSAAILSWTSATYRDIPVSFGKTAAELSRAGPGEALGYIFIILLTATAVAVIFGLLLGIPTLKLREDYLAIVTIGFAEIVRILLLNQRSLTRGPIGLSVSVPGGAFLTDASSGWGSFFRDLRTGPSRIDLDPYYAFLILVAVIVLAVFYVAFEWLARSPWGRVVKAIREDEDVAASLGKNVFVYKLQSLVLGGFVAAVAGVIFAWFQRHIAPDNFLPIVTFYAWIILVLGGVGNNKGPLVGAALLWGVFEAARNVPDLPFAGITDVGGAPRVALIGLLLMIIMMFRPQGVVGRKEEMLFGK